MNVTPRNGYFYGRVVNRKADEGNKQTLTFDRNDRASIMQAFGTAMEVMMTNVNSGKPMIIVEVLAVDPEVEHDINELRIVAKAHKDERERKTARARLDLIERSGVKVGRKYAVTRVHKVGAENGDPLVLFSKREIVAEVDSPDITE
jgi:hypothetical protein